METHHQLSSTLDRTVSGLGRVVWASGLVEGQSWTPLVVVHTIQQPFIMDLPFRVYKGPFWTVPKPK